MVPKFCLLHREEDSLNPGGQNSNGQNLLSTRKSSYCFQCILAIAILSVHPSVTRVDQSKAVQARITKIFTCGYLYDSSFRNRKDFP